MTRFRRLEPSHGYISDNLYIPKDVVNPEPLRKALTFLLSRDRKPVIDETTGEIVDFAQPVEMCWDETATHFIAPREFPLDFESYPEIQWKRETLFTGPTLNLSSPTVPTDVQARALERMLLCESGTVNLACGKGKTALSLLHTVKKQRPSLIVVNKKAQIRQWKNEIAQHIDPSLPVGVIRGDEDEWRGYPIVIATVLTLAKKRLLEDMEFRTYFGQVYYDEGHHMSAPVFSRAADICFGERYSLTATATRADKLHYIYQYHLGPIIFQDLTQELIPFTTFYKLDWDLTEEQEKEIVDRGGNINWGLFNVMLAKIDWRNQFIAEKVEEAVKGGAVSLVLSHTVNGARALYEELKSVLPNAGLITGPDVPDEDERIRILNDANPCVGVFELAKEALNKRELTDLDIASSWRSSNDQQQAMGRIQRAMNGKRKDPRVRVYEDVNVQMSTRQCNDLRKYLRALNYPYKVVDVEISQ